MKKALGQIKDDIGKGNIMPIHTGVNVVSEAAALSGNSQPTPNGAGAGVSQRK